MTDLFMTILLVGMNSSLLFSTNLPDDNDDLPIPPDLRCDS